MQEITNGYKIVDEYDEGKDHVFVIEMPIEDVEILKEKYGENFEEKLSKEFEKQLLELIEENKKPNICIKAKNYILANPTNAALIMSFILFLILILIITF